MPHRSLSLSILAAVVLVVAGSAAFADEIVVDGKPLSGKVVKVKKDGLEVETTYGKGNVLVPYDKVTSLHTDEPFEVISGDEGEVVGKLVGVRDKDTLLVGDDPATANAVAVSSLFDSVTQAKFDESGLLRMKSRLRYWKGHYDLAFAATNATDDSVSFSTGFEVERKKEPTRFLASANYRLGTNDPNHKPESTTENEITGLLRGEYDLTPRFYAFTSLGAEYDEVEDLSLRLTPKVGPGVHILKSDNYTWNVDAAPAYVYENYFGSHENKYWAISFGTDGSLALPWGSKLTFRGDYTPAIDDWKNDYLINAKADLTFPMTEWLSFKTGLVEQFNNAPVGDTHKNSLTGTAGVSLVF
jgi:hypothetical protein